MNKTIENLEKFADICGLLITIRMFDLDTRRCSHTSGHRYRASFKNTSSKEDGYLIGHQGTGNTPNEAMVDYAKQIELGILVKGFGENRIEYNVQKLVS